MTPLHVAVMEQQQKTVKVLLQAGADPNVQTNDGRTPLHHAAMGECAEIVTLLLEYGARCDLADSFGDLPTDWARAPEITAIFRPDGTVEGL